MGLTEKTQIENTHEWNLNSGYHIAPAILLTKMDKLTTATSLIQEFLPLVEKYESALLKISKDPFCPDNLRKLANEAIDFGKEVVDFED